MRRIAIGGKAARKVESLFARRDGIQHSRSSDAAQHLRDDVCRQFRSRESLAHTQSHQNGGIQVASRNVADCKRHSHDREAECQSDSREANAEARKSRGKYRTAASAEHEPKGSYKFRKRSFGKGHTEKLSFQCRLHPATIALSRTG